MNRELVCVEQLALRGAITRGRTASKRDVFLPRRLGR
jgi:hypothetical protein